MIPDIRKLKPGTLLKIKCDLVRYGDREFLEKNRIVMFLDYSLKIRNEEQDLSIKVLNNNKTMWLFLAKRRVSKELPEDLAATFFTCFYFDVVGE
jgi:hypothetical protein